MSILVVPRRVVISFVVPVLALAFLAVFITASRGQESSIVAPLSGDQSWQLEKQNAVKQKFDGTLAGWRIGPWASLQAEGLDSAKSSCVPTALDPKVQTDLDFELSYLPAGVTVDGVSAPEKAVCGGTVTAVAYTYHLVTPFGVGYMDVARTRMDTRALMVDASTDRVSSSTISGKPAILVHPLYDATFAYGQGEVIVIEENTLKPWATVLHIIATDVQMDELVKTAEGIR